MIHLFHHHQLVYWMWSFYWHSIFQLHIKILTKHHTLRKDNYEISSCSVRSILNEVANYSTLHYTLRVSGLCGSICSSYRHRLLDDLSIRSFSLLVTGHVGCGSFFLQQLHFVCSQQPLVVVKGEPSPVTFASLCRNVPNPGRGRTACLYHLFCSAAARGRLQPERAAPPDAVSSRLLTASASGMMRSSTGAATVQQRKPAGQPLHTIFTTSLLWYKIHIVNIHRWNESINQNSEHYNEFLFIA